MGKFVLIGGGENGRGDKPYETKAIDEEIVRLSGKEKPVFLFIGLASSFSDSYYDVMKKNYQNLGCETVYLKKKNIINNPQIVEDKIKKADIIYMCGGDTTKLVRELKEYKIDILLKEAIERGCILTGISAGAIALCNSGLSDYLILSNQSDKYAFTSGLSFLDIDICPHGNSLERINDLKELLKDTNKKVLVIDNGIALEIIDDKCFLVRGLKNCNIHIVYWNKDTWHDEIIEDNIEYQDLLKKLN